MLQQKLFDGEVHVHYGQLYVHSDDRYPLLEEAFLGQTNGLCGAASAGALFMITGLHTGHVGFTVERHDAPPSLDQSWEEAVEVSFTPTSTSVRLVQWAGEAAWPLDLPVVDWRVRYCARGMDEGRSADTILQSEPTRDSYLLQFWPGAKEADRIVKVTSSTAENWHAAPRHPAATSTAAERADRIRLGRAPGPARRTVRVTLTHLTRSMNQPPAMAIAKPSAVLPSSVVNHAALIGFGDAIVCAAAGGLLWRRKGGHVADGIGLGWILGGVGLVLLLALRPRRRDQMQE